MKKILSILSLIAVSSLFAGNAHVVTGEAQTQVITENDVAKAKTEKKSAETVAQTPELDDTAKSEEAKAGEPADVPSELPATEEAGKEATTTRPEAVAEGEKVVAVEDGDKAEVIDATAVVSEDTPTPDDADATATTTEESGVTQTETAPETANAEEEAAAPSTPSIDDAPEMK